MHKTQKDVAVYLHPFVLFNYYIKTLVNISHYLRVEQNLQIV